MNKSLPSLSLFGNTYLEHLERRIHDSNNKQFSDEDLLTLYSVYGTALQRALDVLEKYPIVDTYSTANKGRVLIEIKGKTVDREVTQEQYLMLVQSMFDVE
ncbi:jg5063 [Pararge aegeria aegeria]|uniref:Jg5063 protein n=1 Tax=Pararge aegeria aegeria TaxID=348720 RepID=A0A8S4R467_9NEOP|nr:jg5063 [Pararge aegeria aegeria]